MTSTSQHLQLWDGMPTGPVSLCDQKKIKNSYATIKWCPVLQKLFCGDVLGGIDVWRIVLLPPAATAAVGHTNKPTLVKVRRSSTAPHATAQQLQHRTYGHSLCTAA